MKLSARNTLKGTITAIHPGAVNAIVIMELEGGQLITSTISMGSLKE
ncbi:TOBE domain-containing protein, partial [Gordonibacter sp.]